MSEEITITPKRFLGEFTANVTIEERHSDRNTITRMPVETGAEITDHAYAEPAELELSLGWSNSAADSDGTEGYVADVYAKLLALKNSRVKFDVQTGKRLYTNMLFAALEVTTDEKSEAALMVHASLQEIITVSTHLSNEAPQADQALPEKTASPASAGVKQPVPSTFDKITAALQGSVSTALKSVVEVPMSAAPQVFGITLAQKAYQMTSQWRDAAGGGWMLDIADSVGTPILQGLPLVTGGDLLGQFAHLGLGGQLAVQTDHDLDAVPTFANLGSAARLFFGAT